MDCVRPMPEAVKATATDALLTTIDALHPDHPTRRAAVEEVIERIARTHPDIVLMMAARVELRQLGLEAVAPCA